MALDGAHGPLAQCGEEAGARSKLHIRQGDKADQFKLILRPSPIYPSRSKNPGFCLALHILLNGC